MSEQELKEDLILLLQKYEQHHKGAFLWENLSPQTKKQIKGIVGFKIKVVKIQATYKLSQNRNEMDYANNINKLYDEVTPYLKKMAKLMEKRLNSYGEINGDCDKVY